MNKGRALVVFSGGQDSTTCLFWAKKTFATVEAITFDYGQRHRVELDCAKHICQALGVEQKIVAMDFLSQLSSNALVDSNVAISASGGFQGLPSTFVPGRNILFLTLAAAYAIPRGLNNIVVGVCQADFSGYPDCRESFVQSMEQTLREGLASPELVIHRPLMNLTKAETFDLADQVGALSEVLEFSHTCYEGNRTLRHTWGYGCGSCPACELRKKGFIEYLNAKNLHAIGGYQERGIERGAT